MESIEDFLYNLRSTGLITDLCHLWCQLREIKVGLLSLTPNKGRSHSNVSGPLLQEMHGGLNMAMQAFCEHGHSQSSTTLDTARLIKPLSCYCRGWHVCLGEGGPRLRGFKSRFCSVSFGGITVSYFLLISVFVCKIWAKSMVLMIK